MEWKVFTYPLLIKETYLDTFGHVNNATYLTLFEEARWDSHHKKWLWPEKDPRDGLWADNA